MKHVTRSPDSNLQGPSSKNSVIRRGAAKPAEGEGSSAPSATPNDQVTGPAQLRGHKGNGLKRERKLGEDAIDRFKNSCFLPLCISQASRSSCMRHQPDAERHHLRIKVRHFAELVHLSVAHKERGDLQDRPHQIWLWPLDPGSSNKPPLFCLSQAPTLRPIATLPEVELSSQLHQSHVLKTKFVKHAMLCEANPGDVKTPVHGIAPLKGAKPLLVLTTVKARKWERPTRGKLSDGL